MCALVFAPLNQLDNWLSHSQEHIESRDCGLTKLHKGFFNEFQAMIGAQHWGDTFLPIISSSQCATGLLAVGHGFGGAVATMYAACAAKQKHLGASGLNIPQLLRGNDPSSVFQPAYFANLPPTSGLYTFGAPGVSHEQIQSASADDGSFAGARFYTEDDDVLDVIPFSGSIEGWIHPKLAAVRLKQESSGWVNRVEFLAGTDSALEEPDDSKDTDSSLHSPSQYVTRLQVAPLISGISRPGSAGVPMPVHDGGHHATSMSSPLYGVEGNRSGEPQTSSDAMYVAPEGENQTIENAAATLCLGGVVVALHAVEGLF